MTYSAEFIVNVGQFEHVKFTVTASTIVDFHQQMGQLTGSNAPEFAGDTHASLKAAVLYGRDQAVNALKSNPVDLTESAQELVEQLDAEELIVQELDAKVIDVQDKSTKPWERPVEAAPVKPWEVVSEQSAKPADDPFADF